jgi:hypothetical protein
VYYAQRATKQGLLISEAAHVMPAISEYVFFISLSIAFIMFHFFVHIKLLVSDYWSGRTFPKLQDIL